MGIEQRRSDPLPIHNLTHPKVLLCHFPFGKDPEAIREYVGAHRYDGVEWGLDSWRMMAAHRRRQQMLDQMRRAAPLCSADLQNRPPEMRNPWPRCNAIPDV